MSQSIPGFMCTKTTQLEEEMVFGAKANHAAGCLRNGLKHCCGKVVNILPVVGMLFHPPQFGGAEFEVWLQKSFSCVFFLDDVTLRKHS